MSQVTIERTSKSSGEELTLETSDSNLHAPVILPLSARLANQIFVKPCSTARLLLPWAEMTRGPVSSCLLLTITVVAVSNMSYFSSRVSQFSVISKDDI